jgi:hypothetical protein
VVVDMRVLLIKRRSLSEAGQMPDVEDLRVPPVLTTLSGFSATLHVMREPPAASRLRMRHARLRRGADLLINEGAW